MRHHYYLDDLLASEELQEYIELNNLLVSIEQAFLANLCELAADARVLKSGELDAKSRAAFNHVKSSIQQQTKPRHCLTYILTTRYRIDWHIALQSRKNCFTLSDDVTLCGRQWVIEPQLTRKPLVLDSVAAQLKQRIEIEQQIDKLKLETLAINLNLGDPLSSLTVRIRS